MELGYLQYAVLHSMLNDPGCVGEVMTRLTAADFDQVATRGVFEAISRLYLAGAPVDPVTVVREAGDDYFPALEEAARHPAGDAVYYAGLLREGMQLKRLHACARELEDAETPEAAERAIARINELTTLRKGVEVVTAHQAAADFHRRMTTSQRPEYLPLGMGELEELLFIEPGDFVLIGGYPSAGKTLLSLQIALALAERRLRVGYFSLETSPRKLTDRLISHMGGVPLQLIKNAPIQDEGAAGDATAAVRRLDKLPLELVPAGGMSVRDIQATALNRRYQAVFVDYLQIVAAPGKNRYEQVTAVSIALHTMAQAHGMAVFALAQLSRPDKTEGKPIPPNMASFRESGQLEQDADAALLLWPEDPNNNRSRRVLKIAKNKDGDRGSLLLAFSGAKQTLTAVPGTLRRGGEEAP